MLLARRRAGTGRAPRTRLTCANRAQGSQQVWHGLTAGAVNEGGSAPIRRALHKVAIPALPGRVALAGALAGVGGISNAHAAPTALPLTAVRWNRAAAARDEPTLAQEVEVARTVARRQGRTIAREQREHLPRALRKRESGLPFLVSLYLSFLGPGNYKSVLLHGSTHLAVPCTHTAAVPRGPASDTQTRQPGRVIMSDTPPLSCRQFLSVLRVPHAPCIPSLPYRTPPQCTSLVAYLVGGARCRQTREGGRRRLTAPSGRST